jgi:NAD(P)-dependent dehydrogenase (short-subunit alcohol dehydrogenase family)
MLRAGRLLFVALITLALAGTAVGQPAAPGREVPPDSAAFVRVNQVGYLPAGPKVAVVCALRPIALTGFTVQDARGRVVLGPRPARRAGAFGPCVETWRLDFSTLRAPGRYRIRAGTYVSGPVHVAADAYREPADTLLAFMRQQRSGYIMAISSGAGLSGFEFNSAYAAAKFGLEGWMESLHPEVAPFGIHTTIVNPGMFRTELLTEQSATYATSSIADYAERGPAQREGYEAQNGRQAGDPAKLAQALVMLASQEQPPRRFIAGSDAIAIAEQKAKDLQEQANAFRDLSTSMAVEEG